MKAAVMSLRHRFPRGVVSRKKIRSGAKGKSKATRRSDGNAKTYESASDADVAPRIKRRRAGNGKVRAGGDIRRPKM